MREVRDRVLLLSLGNAYLCEPSFLRKIGGELEFALTVLDDEISKFKKKFPGRFAQEIDTDSILKGMRDVVLKIKSSDKKVQEQCTVGRLGRDLENRLKTLSEAVDEIRRKVEGGPQAYTGKEAVAGALSQATKAVPGGLGILFKVLGAAVILAAGAFLFLFVTMEKQGGIEAAIGQAQAEIQVLEGKLGEIQERMRPVEKEMNALAGKTFDRKSKVKWLELQVELNKMEDEAKVVEGDLALKRMALAEEQEKLAALQGRSFIERLLRLK